MRAKGWRPNPKGVVRAPFHLYAARLVQDLPTPKSVDLERHAPPVKNQTNTSSCTGHGMSTGIKTSCPSLPFVPSEEGLYTNGRCIDRASSVPRGALPPLTDDGATIDAVAKGISVYGVRPSKGVPPLYSDCSEATINQEPTLRDFEEERHDILVGEYTITSTGNHRIDDLRRALAAGFAVVFGAFVDTAFEEWTFAKGVQGACDTSDPNGGGHCMCFIGYTTLDDGSTVFKVRNSWGLDWGDRGNIYVNEAFTQACEDLTVMDVTLARRTS